MTAAAERVTLTPGVQVLIVAGRFGGQSARFVGAGPEWATVDLGVPVDGGNGVVIVPVTAVREAEQ